MKLEPNKKIYFASDQHFGAPNKEESKVREARFVRWLDTIKQDAQALYIVGDLFDFWFEYATVVPKGYVRVLGKLAELADSGVQLHFFTGNHDMWAFDYLPQEIGLTLYREPVVHEFNSTKMLIGHGDGLGPGDYSYKFLKKVFANPVCQWLFARLHPNFGIGIANYFSKSSRASNGGHDKTYLGAENEWLAIYCKEYLEKDPSINYFVFGHRHLPLSIQLNKNSSYINIGDWIVDFTYGVFDGTSFKVETFESTEVIIRQEEL